MKYIYIPDDGRYFETNHIFIRETRYKYAYSVYASVKHDPEQEILLYTFSSKDDALKYVHEIFSGTTNTHILYRDKGL